MERTFRGFVCLCAIALGSASVAYAAPQGDQQAGGTQHDDREERDRMLVEAFHGRGEPWCWPW